PMPWFGPFLSLTDVLSPSRVLGFIRFQTTGLMTLILRLFRWVIVILTRQRCMSTRVEWTGLCEIAELIVRMFSSPRRCGRTDRAMTTPCGLLTSLFTVLTWVMLIFISFTGQPPNRTFTCLPGKL